MEIMQRIAALAKRKTARQDIIKTYFLPFAYLWIMIWKPILHTVLQNNWKKYENEYDTITMANMLQA